MIKLNLNRYTIILLTLLVGYMLVEIYRPQPVDWAPTYSNKDKIPYGTFVLFELLEDVFPNQQIKSTRETPYIALKDSNKVRGSYIFINQNFRVDKNDLNSLLHFVEKGNNVFIAAEHFSKNFEDSLQLGIRTRVIKEDTLFAFKNPLLGQKEYSFSGQYTNYFFRAKDSLNTVLLAESKQGKAVFIKVKYGNGAFFLHSQPQIFTNFYLLKDDGLYDYAFKSLSYLPVGNVTWDEYFKQGSEGVDSVLGVIMRYPTLRWAYYLALLALVLFVIFRGKRRQRAIPIVEPFKNTSLEFAGVVSSLYYNQHDFKQLALKKIMHFKEFVYRQYHEYLEGSDAGLAKRISAKSGIEQDTVQKLLFNIAYIYQRDELDEKELHEMNNKIEEFYKQAVFSGNSK